jgi:hypothetical protein
MIGGYTYYGSNENFKTAPMYSLRGGYSITDNIGVEAGLDYSITKSTLVTDKNVAIFKYGVEGLYHFMPEGNLVPFLAVGLGGYNLSGPSVLVSRKEMGFVDYGAGVKYFLNDRVALRADVRHILANADAIEYTLGVTIPFGGAKGVTKPVTEPFTSRPVDKKHREQAVTPQIEVQERAAEDKSIQKDVSKEGPTLPVVVAPEESKTTELSSSERLAQLKEQFAKEESKRITTFKAEWEKERESRIAAEKTAMAQETPDQAKARNEQGMKGEGNISSETAKQTEKPSMTGSKKKSTLKKRHKTATRKKQHRPAAPQ